MKNIKRFASVVMVLMMMLSMMIPAMADGTLTGGSITISNAIVGETYNAYQIFYLESYDSTAEAYAYKVNSAWSSFINGESIKDVYVKVDAQGYVTWVEDADAAAFAKLAQAAIGTTITSDGSAVAETETVTISNLNLGYYLVDTSLGTLCSLDTTNPTVTMTEKNVEPTIEKYVIEGNEKLTFSDADIGDTVNFEVTINAYKGADSYILHDNFLTDGFTPVDGDDEDSLIDVKIMVDGTEVDAANYTVRASECGKCDFEIVFAQTYLDTITSNTTITISYSAILNENAELFGPAPNSNTNQAWLTYGDDATSTEIWHTYTHTYQFDLIKTDSKDKLLDGAEFELYGVDGNKINLVDDGDVYRRATAQEAAADNFESAPIDVENGSARITGLDSGTYSLKETVTPAGYNTLANDVNVVIVVDDANVFDVTVGNDAEDTGNMFATVTDEDVYTEGGIRVINNNGTELPSTGGIGTTIFYCAGAILAVGAFVLLITKKRMSREM